MEIFVGQKITECYIADREPATITEVLTPTTFAYRRNRCKKAEGAEWYENKWDILEELEGPVCYGKLKRNGKAYQADFSEKNHLKVHDGVPFLAEGHHKYYCYEM